MWDLAAAQGDLVRAVGSHQQDTAIADLPAEVKEQVVRGNINPVQIFQDEQYGTLGSNRFEHGCVLRKDALLLQSDTLIAGGNRQQLLEPGCLRGRKGGRALTQGFSRYKAINQ